jgi:hypothetical protein
MMAWADAKDDGSKRGTKDGATDVDPFTAAIKETTTAIKMRESCRS